MKEKEVLQPALRKNTVPALIEHMIANGMSDFAANQFVHTNIPALGEYRNIIDVVREGNWDEAWNVVDAYLRGDYF